MITCRWYFVTSAYIWEFWRVGGCWKGFAGIGSKDQGTEPPGLSLGGGDWVCLLARVLPGSHTSVQSPLYLACRTDRQRAALCHCACPVCCSLAKGTVSNLRTGSIVPASLGSMPPVGPLPVIGAKLAFEILTGRSILTRFSYLAR